ncbi:hypothetical protein JNUCC23_04375 [Peribacillus sp. JNUCC 23]
MRRFQCVFMILSLLIMAACGRNESVPNQRDEHKKEIVHETENNGTNQTEQSILSDFFMKDGAIAEYLGIGNEYAQYNSRTQWLNDHYVNVYEDNGGTVMLRTFRIEENKVVVVKEISEAYDDYLPTENELDQLNPLYTYLQLPLKTGSEFDGWKVIEDSLILSTPYKQFENVIVIEINNEDHSVTRKYFVAGLGEVKREFTMQEGKEKTTITSVLEKIN